MFTETEVLYCTNERQVFVCKNSLDAHVSTAIIISSVKITYESSKYLVYNHKGFYQF